MFTLNCKGRLVEFHHPLVMGIVNITPDSFFEESRTSEDEILRKVEGMLSDGADIIDIGAQSSRPGAELLTSDEELQRLDKILHPLATHFPHAIFSIDTFYSKVAAIAVDAGFSIINDISGGQIDSEMLAVAAKLGTPYVCMHMRGTPQTMVALSDYENVTSAVLDYFIGKIGDCHAAGINDVIIDPGFGFSKNISQNFELLNNLAVLKMTNRPILAGLSRKSTIYKTLGITAKDSLNGSTVMNTIALMNGANILRVHDVREARECVTLFSKL